MSGSLYRGVLPPVEDDDVLESMLTDMEDVSFSRTTACRNGGVGVDDSRGERERVQDTGQTPGTWSGACQGTSGSVRSTIYGQPETVLSESKSYSVRVPHSVSIRSGRSSTAKKYKLVRLPQTEEGYSDICLGLIGHGTMFCTARRCKTAHQGTVLSVTPGELYLAKTATTAFADSKTHYMRLTPELWSEWNNSSFTLEEWSGLFMLVNQEPDDGPATAAEVEARVNFAAKAEAH